MFSKIQTNVFTCRNSLLENQLTNNIRLHETSFNPQDCFGTSQTCSVHLFTAVMHRFVRIADNVETLGGFEYFRCNST